MAGAVKFDEVLFMNGFSGNNSSFASGMTVDGCRVKGSLTMSGAAGQGGLTLSSLTVEGNLAPPISLEGTLAVSEVTVSQNFITIDGTYADMGISRLHVDGSSDMTGAHFTGKVVIADTDFGRVFNATETLFDGDVEFRKVRFPGEDPMEGALFAKAPTLVDTTLPRPPRVKSEEPPEPDDGGAAGDEDDPGAGGD